MPYIKKIFKAILILFALACICRLSYSWWVMGKPRHEIEQYVTGLRKTDKWADEYTHNGVWTATDGTAYSFTSYNVAKLDSATYNPDCGCFQWERKIGESWYTISICPDKHTAYSNMYFHSLLDILCE